MQKLYKNIFIIISLSFLLSACSVIEFISLGPKKMMRKTTDTWDRKIEGKPENWQQDLDLGPKRRPVNNPDPNQLYSNDPTSMITNEESNIPLVETPNDSQRIYSDEQQDSIDNFQYPGDVPGLVPNSGGYVSEPEKPWLQDGNNMGDSPFNTSPDSYMGSEMPSVNDFAPFAPTQHKLIRRFEPASAEFFVNEDEGPIDLDIHISDAKKQRQKNSMFPYEQYAPKSDVVINQVRQSN